VTIARTAFKGGTWGPGDTIYFANGAGLLKVAATGGEPQKVTNLDVKRREVDQVFPEVLPGGKVLLYTARTMEQASFDEADIAAVNLASGERKILVKQGTDPHPAPRRSPLLSAGSSPARSVISTFTAIEGTPIAFNSESTRWFFSSFRPNTATAAPASANPSAMLRPIPPLPPVTTTTRPVKSNNAGVFI
jgi:hypothetical protein